jgi:tetratricopeptide (TPR) repeat protein
MIKDHKNHLLATLLLALLTFAVYWQVLHHSFLMNWDDFDYLGKNEMIRGVSWQHIKRAFAAPYFYNYSPLHMISYMVDYSLFGGINTAGFFFVNILIHLLSGIVLYFLVLRLSGKALPSFLAAFIFLLHPVQVESVAWISQRKNVLAMLFFLGSLWSYLAFRLEKERRRAWSFYLLSVIAFGCALLAKSAAVVLPAILVMFDLCYLQKGERRGWLVNKIAYALASAAMVLITIKSQGDLVDEGRAVYHASGPLETFYTMLTVLAKYLGMLLLPLDLSAVYMPTIRFRFDGAVASAAALLVLLAVCAWLLYRRQPKMLFWYSIFFISLLPVSHLVPLPTLMNDRYLYFPLVGAAVFLAIPMNLVYQRAGGKLKIGAACVLALVLLALPLLSWQRAQVWRDDTSFWFDVTRKAPTSPLGWSGLGMSYYDAKRPEEALQAYLQALAIDPNHRLALGNVGGLYNEMGKLDLARPYLIRAVQLFPEEFGAQMNLGGNYLASGEFAKAEAVYLKALQLDARSVNAWYALADAYLGLRKPEKAREALQKAGAVDSSDPDVEYKLAALEAVSGHPEEALQHLQSSLAMGFKNLELLKSDHSLDSLRGYPAFKTLLEK